MLVLGMQHSEDSSLATWMLFISNIGMSFSDVIVDSLLVIQARKHPGTGAEDLNSFSWTCSSIGVFFSSIAAAYLTEYYDAQHCFMLSSILGLVLAFCACRLNSNLENEGRVEAIGEGSLWMDM